MIPLSSTLVLDRLQSVPIKNTGGRKSLMLNYLNSDGFQAMSFLLNKAHIRVTKEVLQKELDDMFKSKMLDETQHTNLSGMLHNNKEGLLRITKFLVRQRRFYIKYPPKKGRRR